ncbi:HsdM family class I SAM-dependent methyltransferase [Aestuariibaculum sediminum]|uniref:site-specific DNA-methyltransferase (adenine-specific) n=1 Tax=Aestuariibaculum sediminum TaxID=2770637 RepID=A0A8J6Q3I9_9FLAO|nr:class I SAM-dependent DNA methyltransferase [Aestuariibaculum sediminum]MBD0833749.1 SAM-dependent DNA methyltransferase [Aestuariibaculum sediminum]
MTVEKTRKHIAQTKELIDDLKAVCANYGLGNDGNEFKIITQIFLYKYLNDKFTYELRKVKPEIFKSEDWVEALKALPEDEYKKLEFQIESDIAFLKPEHFIPYLFNRQDQPDFAKRLDETLLDIAATNNDLFAVTTPDGVKIRLFEPITEYVSSKRDAFAKALINKLVNDINFEDVMTEGFDFFSTIFEYLIKDYNNDAGGKYAEYYTPHAVSKIMAAILVPEPVENVTIFDPSAGSGTLLMTLAHAIGANKCTVYSQDISQKSSNLLRLNLVLNNLVHSIQNVIQGNTMTNPYHRGKTFNYIVSNPPFKLDFSDDIDELNKKVNQERFFAGIPNVPKKAKSKMAIYSMFLQHIMYSLDKNKGKAAIVIPTGFITAQSGIDKKIREEMIARNMLAGVVSMPSNIFATTGTNVSIVFLDTQNDGNVVLIDASNLGRTVKDGKNQKTVLDPKEEQQIIETFINNDAIDDFSVVVSYDDIKAKNYSLSAGQYFEVKIEYVDITGEEFDSKLKDFESNLNLLFAESDKLEKEINDNLNALRYD